MADKKTYYYLKLKEGFFDSEDMLLLQGMKDGYIYSDILLKLYLMSLRQDGRLMYRGIIPYTPDMVATITHHQVGTVEKAMKVLTSMGFIEILDNGAIYMLDIQNFIGRSSNEADRKREYRATINAEKSRIIEDKEGQMSRQMSDVRAPENRDRVRERDRDKERDREGTLRPRLWPLPECFPDGRGNGRLAGQLSHRMGPVHRKAVRIHGFYRQAVSEPCRHHPALGR